jgi:hypothetical protein
MQSKCSISEPPQAHKRQFAAGCKTPLRMKRFAIILLCGIFIAAAGVAGAEAKIYAGMAVFNKADDKYFRDIIPLIGLDLWPENLPHFYKVGSLGIFRQSEYEDLVNIAGDAYLKENAELSTAIIASIVKALPLIRFSLEEASDEIARFYLIVLSDFQENSYPGNVEKGINDVCQKLDAFEVSGQPLRRIMIRFDSPTQTADQDKKDKAKYLMERLAGKDALFFDHTELYQAQSEGYKILRDIVEDAMSKDENIGVYYLFDRSGSTNDGGEKQKDAVEQAVASIIARRIFSFEEDLIAVEGGPIMIGDDSIQAPSYLKPAHSVDIKDFWIAPRAVTEYQYWFVMNKKNNEKPDGQNWNEEPRKNISYFDAVEFCNALSRLTKRPPYYTIKKDDKGNILEVTENPEAAAGFRLPSEYEWEYAARKIDDKDFIFGEILEWTQSDFHPYLTENRKRSNHKVQKGWDDSYPSEKKKPGERYWNLPDQCEPDFGFRYCVSSIEYEK